MKNTMISPFVSVVIPVYNVAPYLSACLDSILGQTLSNIEVICINDGSTDDSLSILEHYSQSDSRLLIQSQPNAGQSAARNAGVHLATGQYLYFMDSDDILELSALEILYTMAREQHLDALYFDGTSFSESDECQEQLAFYQNYYIRQHSYSDHVYSGKAFMAALLSHNEYRTAPCLQFINRTFFLENELWFLDGIIHEDNLFTYQCMLCAERVAHIPDRLFHRRVRPDSTMTKKVSAANVKGYFYCYLHMHQFYTSLQLEDEYDAAALEILKRVLGNARNNYMILTPEERNACTQLPAHDRLLLNLYVINFCDARIQKQTLEHQLKTVSEEKHELHHKLQETYAEKSELNHKLQETYAEKSELNHKLQETYAEKSELNHKLQETYAEKSELNHKLQETYREKAERGAALAEARAQLSSLEKQLKQSQLAKYQLEHSLTYRIGKIIMFIPHCIKNLLHKKKSS